MRRLRSMTSPAGTLETRDMVFPAHANHHGTLFAGQGLERMARAKGFLMVSATPLTRSSYHAGEDFARLRDARNAKLGIQAAE